MATTGYDVLSGLKATSTPAPAPDAPKIATSYAPGTAYNPQYGNALNTTATSTVPVASTTPVVSGPSDGNGGGGGGKDSKLPDNNGVIPFIPVANTGSTGPVATGSTGPNPFLVSAAASAFDQFRSQFQAIGLGSLADTLITLSTSPNAPTTSSEYYQALLQTPEYKARFGDTNAMRQKNGLPMLTEGEILKSEMNISDTLRNLGLPAGFYDQPQDFQQFIALDKSAAEVGDIRHYNSTDSSSKEQLLFDILHCRDPLSLKLVKATSRHAPRP